MLLINSQLICISGNLGAYGLVVTAMDSRSKCLGWIFIHVYKLWATLRIGLLTMTTQQLWLTGGTLMQSCEYTSCKTA